MLATLLFTLPPLAGIRSIRPAVIFRREMAEAKPTLRERWQSLRPALIAGAFVLAGMAAIAIGLAGATPKDALRMGTYFAVALVASLGLMALIAWLLLAGVRLFLQRSPWKLPSTLRHGAANLYRPGNHAAAVLVALGIGVMFTLSAYLLERSLVAQIRSSAPPGMPNVFLLDIPGRLRQAFTDLLSRQPGVESKPEIFGAVSLKLATVDGVPVEKAAPGRFRPPLSAHGPGDVGGGQARGYRTAERRLVARHAIRRSAWSRKPRACWARSPARC